MAATVTVTGAEVLKVVDDILDSSMEWIPPGWSSRPVMMWTLVELGFAKEEVKRILNEHYGTDKKDTKGDCNSFRDCNCSDFSAELR